MERGDCVGANGFTRYAERRIRVRDDMDDAQAVKTMIHETAHMLMHDPTDFSSGSTLGCRGEREVEAESVAFLVAGHHGLDTASYSFGYVTGWAQDAAPSAGKPPAEIVRAAGQRVIATALAITEATDAALGRSAAPAASARRRVLAGVQRATELRERAEAGLVAPAGSRTGGPPADAGAQAGQGALFDVPAAAAGPGRGAGTAFPTLRHIQACSMSAPSPFGGRPGRRSGRRR